jgi:transcriptional regulator with GAF, ATPase, and Fis domain
MGPSWGLVGGARSTATGPKSADFDRTRFWLRQALAGNIVGAAQILGITRHALKRRIIKLGIDWNRAGTPASSAPAMPSA